MYFSERLLESIFDPQNDDLVSKFARPSALWRAGTPWRQKRTLRSPQGCFFDPWALHGSIFIVFWDHHFRIDFRRFFNTAQNQ